MWKKHGARGASFVFVIVFFVGACSLAPATAPMAQPASFVQGESLVLAPALSPAQPTCDNAWYQFTTNLSVSGYVTLNADEANSTNTAVWRPSLPEAGYYLVEAYIPAPPAMDSGACFNIPDITQNTTEAIYSVFHQGGETMVKVNQSLSTDVWVSLGVYQFDAGTAGYVFLTDKNNELKLSRFVQFSAVRFTPAHVAFMPAVYNELSTAAPNTPVVIRQLPAFDSCRLPTPGEMQVWWNKSPYWVYNLYIGGISFACDIDLDLAWVTAVRSQGWEYIPAWVGPQAPCSIFRNKFSNEPNTAFNQGIREADMAFARAVELGLVGQEVPKTVIYYDMEAFPDGEPYNPPGSCRTAVNAFLNGWTQRLHELGARSGVYGSSRYYMTDWANIAQPPDDVWLASWYKLDGVYQFDPNANVWNVNYLSPSYWTDHQRLRQYAGTHTETYTDGASKVAITMDSNITDGRIVAPLFGAAQAVQQDLAPVPASQALVTAAGESIAQYQQIAPQQGWALRGGRLLWTNDGGGNWQDITPQGELYDILGAHFRTALDGWLAAVIETQAGSLQWVVLRTNNNGQTWTSTELPMNPGQVGLAESGSASLVFLADGQTGWMSVKVSTSSAFSLGELFGTRDGGATWQRLTIPIGAPVYFSDAKTGWTAGGIQGDEFYVTRDGGATWKPAGFIDIDSGTVYYSLPSFSDPINGLLPVTVADANRPRLEYYATTDGGLSWNLVNEIPLDAEAVPGAPIPSAVIGPQALLAVDRAAERLLSSGEQGLLGPQPEPASLPEGVVELSFSTPLDGWAKTAQTVCSGEKTMTTASSFSCQSSQSLWQTSDGGRTWVKIR